MGNVLSKNIDAKNIDATDSIAKTGASQVQPEPPQKKRVFRMIVEEDLFEQTDDAHCDGLAPRPFSEKKGPMETSSTKEVAPPEEPKLVKPSIQPADKSHLGPISRKTGEAYSSAVTDGIVSNVVSSPASEETNAAAQSAIFPVSAPVEKAASLPSVSNKETELKIERSSSDAFPASAVGSSTANSSGSVPVSNTASSLISGTSSTFGFGRSYPSVAPKSSSVFGSSLQSPRLSTPAFGSSDLTSPSPSTGLAFGARAASSAPSSSRSAFSFTTATSPSILSSPSVIQPWFGDPGRCFGAVATPDQVSVAGFPNFGQQKVSYTPPPFGQPAYSIPSGFGFGSLSSGAEVTAVESSTAPSTNAVSSLISGTNSSSVFGSSLQSPRLSTPAFGSSALTSPSPSTGLAFGAPAASSTLSVFNNPSPPRSAFSFTTAASPSILSSPSVIQPWFGDPGRGLGAVANPDQMPVAAPPGFPIFGQQKASYTPPPFGQPAYSIPSGFGFGSFSSGAEVTAVESSTAPSTNTATSLIGGTNSSSVFGSSLQSPKLCTGFGSSALTSPSPSTGLAYGAQAASSIPSVFNNPSSSRSAFSFTTAATPSILSSPSVIQPWFGDPGRGFGAVATPDQQTSVAAPPDFPIFGQQKATYTPPPFGQPAYSIPSGFGFGSFSSSAPNSSSVVGSSWQTPAFGSSASALMEDIMDEDEDDILQTSVSAPPSFPIYGQQMASSTPSGFGFGSIASQHNPFMFGGRQPNQAVAAAPTGFPVFGQQVASYTPPPFGQPAYSTPSAFGFGPASASQPNPFMFRQQQNQAAAPQQSPSPFQTNQFNSGVRFSFGSSGGDMSGHKIVKNYVNKNRKK